MPTNAITDGCWLISRVSRITSFTQARCRRDIRLAMNRDRPTSGCLDIERKLINCCVAF